MADLPRGYSNVEGPLWPGGLSKQGPHRVESFALCPQLEAFAHDMHLRPLIPRLATSVGNLVHVGLAYRYGLLLRERPAWLVYPDARTALWTCGQDHLEAAQEALRVFDAYEAHYRLNVWTPLLVEHQFEVFFSSLGEPYTARTDLLAVESGEVVLIDHKTMARLSRTVGDDYRTDRQMLTGLALARAAGYDVRRVVINALTKERPQPRFARFDVPISPTAYARLGEDTAYYLEKMNEVRRRYPDLLNRPRNTGSCVRKYGRCDFYPVCADGAQHLVQFGRKTT